MRATIVYRVDAVPGRADAARLTVSLDPVIQGPLAQFSRGDLMRSMVTQLLRQFGRNLEALAAGQPAATASAARPSLGLGALLFGWLRERLRALFGGPRNRP